MQLLPALALISLVLLPKAAPWRFIKKAPKGMFAVVLARIPNTIGMLIENAVISISLASYSFIQPMILVSLFVIALIHREQYSRLNLIGALSAFAGSYYFKLWVAYHEQFTLTEISGSRSRSFADILYFKKN